MGLGVFLAKAQHYSHFIFNIEFPKNFSTAANT